MSVVHRSQGSEDSVVNSMSWEGSIGGLSISWNNLVFSVEGKGSSKGNPDLKTILHGVSGIVRPGKLVAILGPTGSGKTSLLNALSGRLEASKGASLSGRMTVDGSPVDWPTYRRQLAYVEQEDNLFGMLTAEETLTMAAKLRLPRELSDSQKAEFVEGVISELGLRKCRSTIIGDKRRRGVSGGERKRVSVGCELIAGPQAIFLDEPTSGLDSFQALNTVCTMRALASKGRTVMMSIHQPRSSIFEQLDVLLLLSEGRIMYFGPAKVASEYFAALGHHCPMHYNVADFVIDLVSMDYRSREAETRTSALVQDLAKAYGCSAKSDAKDAVPGAHAGSSQRRILPNRKYEATLWTQFKILFQRAWRSKQRDKLALIIQMVSNVIFGLLVGAIYLDTGYEQTELQDRGGLLFFICINQAFGGLFQVVNVFPLERATVVKERASKTYSILPYFVSKAMCEVPFNIWGPLINGCIVYWMSGLNNDASKFILFLCIELLTFFTATGLGLVVSSLTGTVEAASALGPPLMIIFILFGGFYANTENIPVWLSWIENISFFRYSYGAFVVNEFTDVAFPGCPNTVARGKCNAPLATENESASASCTSLECAVPNGNAWLCRLGFENDSLAVNISALLGLCIGLHVIAYLLLRYKKPRFLVVSENSSEAGDIQSPAENHGEVKHAAATVSAGASETVDCV